MPIFTKRLLCSRSNSRTEGRRLGCRGSSSSDDDDVNGPADNSNGRLRCRNNAEPQGRFDEDGDQDGFRFFLTVTNLETKSTPANGTSLEFEHANMDPVSSMSPATEEPPQSHRSKKVAKKSAAKSSCGRASSNEEESSIEDEPAVQLPEDEDFLVLLTGLLAHGPPPPDDFRFLLTLYQAEAAT